MKVNELKELMEDTDDKLEVIIFTAGEAYPVLIAKCTENYPEIGKKVFEIGCGWTAIEF